MHRKHTAFKGLCDRSFAIWKRHILIPLEANLRLNGKFQGDPAVVLDPGSFVAIQKYVGSQKTQYSKSQKKKHQGTGSAAPAKEATKPLAIARAKVWSGNKACHYPPSTLETSGEPLHSELSPLRSIRHAAGDGEGGGGGEDGGSPPPDYGGGEDDDGAMEIDDDEAEKGFSQGTPPAGAMGGGGASKGKGKGKAGGGQARGNGRDGNGTPRRDRGRGGGLPKFTASTMQAFARGSGSDDIAGYANRSASAIESVASALLGGGGAAPGAAAVARAPASAGVSEEDRKWRKERDLLGLMVDYQNNNKDRDIHGLIQKTFRKHACFSDDDEGEDADDA